MIDKKLFRLLGKNRKYIGYVVALMLLGLLANLTVTACICRAIWLAAQFAQGGGGAVDFLAPAVFAVLGIVVRYGTTRMSGDLKDLLGRMAKKELREQIYDKLIRLGVRSTDGMSMAGLTQVAVEGVEQAGPLFLHVHPPVFLCHAGAVDPVLRHGMD